MENELLTKSKHNLEFFALRKEYGEVLNKFLSQEDISEEILNEAYKLGRKAVADHFSMLSITAIHQDSLIEYLQNLETESHLLIADKASVFLDEVLAPFAMITKELRESIHLFNKRSVEFAMRIRLLQQEIHNRKLTEDNLRKSEERYRTLADELKDSLKEKVALLKEVYHRVKNNLQVISSLLNLQVENVPNTEAKKVLLDSAARVKSMALVHEMLYQSSNLAKIEMTEYLHKLLQYLCDIYEVNCSPDNLTVKVEEISLEVDIAVPLGLILNELVSNCFKHAFPDKRLGKILISFENINNKKVLTVQDNGVGIPEDLQIEKSNSLGMRLICNLTRQIAGTLELDRKNGTTFVISIG